MSEQHDHHCRFVFSGHVCRVIASSSVGIGGRCESCGEVFFVDLRGADLESYCIEAMLNDYRATGTMR